MRACSGTEWWFLAAALLLVAPSLAQEAERFFRRHDANKDGKLSREEFPAQIRHMFDRVDADGDGIVTLAEDKAFRRKRRAQPPTRRGTKLPAGVRVERDVAYAGTKNPRQMLDLFLPAKPADARPLPVIAFIHGGAWQGGSKAAGPARVGPFVATGKYAGASIGYRLSGEAIWPAQIHDCKAAIRWLRANARKHNLDPNRIGVWGPSAGGHLVAMLGTTGGVKELAGSVGPHKSVSSRVTCVADWFGPTDFCQMDAHRIPGGMKHDGAGSPESRLIGGPIQQNKDKVAAANPVTYVTKDDPPFLIAHGDKDPLVPCHQSELLYAALRDAGCDVALIKVLGAGHGGFRSSELERRLAMFFDKHLRGRDAEVPAKPVRKGQQRAKD